MIPAVPPHHERKPQRIQRKRTKGWKMPDGAIYVGRPTQWGNPFAVGWLDARRTEYWDAAKCVEMFRFTTCATDRPGIFTTFEMGEIDVTPLRGHDLACWCPLDQPCHADVLLEIANVDPPSAPVPPRAETLAKAIKLIEALIEPCISGGDDHNWRACRRCLATAELDEGNRAHYVPLLESLLAACAVAPVPPRAEPTTLTDTMTAAMKKQAALASRLVRRPHVFDADETPRAEPINAGALEAGLADSSLRDALQVVIDSAGRCAVCGMPDGDEHAQQPHGFEDVDIVALFREESAALPRAAAWDDETLEKLWEVAQAYPVLVKDSVQGSDALRALRAVLAAGTGRT